MHPSSRLRSSLPFLVVTLAIFLALSTRAAETILQYFGTTWREIESRLPEIAEAGYTSLWLPPPHKAASGTFSVGYDPVDRFDLGDKDRSGTVPTRYGTAADLLRLVKAAHRFGIRVYFDTVMAHNGGPLDPVETGELLPGIPGFVPEDFHLVREEDGSWRKATNDIDYTDEWQVLNRNPFGWDIAQESPNTSFNPNGTTEGQDYPKWSGVRHPGETQLYLDTDLPVATDFTGQPVYTFANKEAFEDTGYGAGATGAGNGRFDWDDVDDDGQHDVGEDSEPFSDTGIDGSNPARQTLTWGFGDGVYNMGDPVDEDVNQMLFRALRWFVDTAKADGFRLDAVKHVPSYFFGKQSGSDKDYVDWGYTGQIQTQFNVTRGMGDWSNHRDTVFTNTLARDDALIYGEHLGAPPAWPPYLEAGMRVANDDFINTVNGFGGIGGSLANYDQPGHGTLGTIIGVGYAMSHDNNFLSDLDRPAAHRYLLTREGLPIVYTDGYNESGAPDFFPKPADVPFVGQFGQDWVTGPLAIRRDFVRGSQVPRWQDQDFAAWEMRDKRENPSMTDADGTVVFVMMARNFTSGQARGAATAFPAGARLRNYSEFGGPFHVTVSGDGTVRDDGGQLPVVPSGGYFAFAWDNPRLPALWQGSASTPPIQILQGGQPVDTMLDIRDDGEDGDPAYPLAVPVPRVTDGGDLSFIARSDGGAESILLQLDGGIDVNSQMGIGPQSGDLRDNPPPTTWTSSEAAQDIVLGFEQMQYIDRTAERFASAETSRNVVGSAGAESWEVTIGQPGTTRFDGDGPVTSQGTVSWVTHSPEAAGPAATVQFTPQPDAAGDVPITLSFLIGYDDEPETASVYFTTDGMTFPEGSFGRGKGTTQVATAIRGSDGPSDPSGTPSWWSATLPAMPTGTVVRYKVGVHRANAPSRFPFSAGDIAIKERMESVFAIDGFDAETVSYFPHNDHGTVATGLEEGFHILRTKAFLQRPGRSAVFRTETQTFYYDTELPDGAILFPTDDGDVIGSGTYGVVVVTDASVESVSYNILDSDPGNDRSRRGNGTGFWAEAEEVLSSVAEGSGFTKEWRFNYLQVPASGAADIRVRLREASSSADDSLPDPDGWFTTITRRVSTGFPATLRVAFPASDGETVGAGYVVKAAFDKSLANGLSEAELLEEFSIYLTGPSGQEVFQDRSGYSIFYDETPSEHAIAFTLPSLFDGEASTFHPVHVTHVRGDVSLEDTRLVLAEPTDDPDGDNDTLPDAWEESNGLSTGDGTGDNGPGGNPDGDALTNIEEFLFGGAANQPGAEDVTFITADLLAGSDIELQFHARPGRVYQVWRSGDLNAWEPVSEPFSVGSDRPDHTWSEPASEQRRFYRIAIALP